MLASLSSPSANGLPLKTGGSASVLSVSRPARRSLAFRPAWSLSRPWRPLTPECFRPFRYLHDPPWLLPTGATVVGRDSHPLEEGAFPRRTVTSWITLFSAVPGRLSIALWKRHPPVPGNQGRRHGIIGRFWWFLRNRRRGCASDSQSWCPARVELPSSPHRRSFKC